MLWISEIVSLDVVLRIDSAILTLVATLDRPRAFCLSGGEMASVSRHEDTRIMSRTSRDLSLEEKWERALKAVTARFVRGNIAAQNRRMRLKQDADREHKRAVQIARQWKRRADSQAA